MESTSLILNVYDDLNYRGQPLSRFLVNGKAYATPAVEGRDGCRRRHAGSEGAAPRSPSRRSMSRRA